MATDPVRKLTRGMNGVALVLVTLGGLALLAGLRNAGLVDTARALIRGQLPTSKDSAIGAERTGVAKALEKVGSAVGSGAANLLNGLSGVVGKYKLGPVKSHVARVADLIGAYFGLKTIGGWRANDPYPYHPGGVALDFMIDDIPNGKAVGDQIAAILVQYADAWRVNHIIWNRRSWNSKRRTWVAYEGSNPHTDHVHADFFE